MSAADTDLAADTDQDSRIIDQGYRTYDGPRSGLYGAIRSLAFHSARFALGLGRSARHKILPWSSLAIAWVPALFIVGFSVVLNVLIGGEDEPDRMLISYPDYYGFIIPSLYLFCCIVIPDILVTDRRNGMLSLYMSTPLQRWSYLLAKALSSVLTLAIITVSPVLILLISYTLADLGPSSVVDWFALLVRVIVAGVVVSVSFTAVTMAASSLTDRRAYASVGMILMLLITAFFASLVVDEAEKSPYFYAVDIRSISTELVNRIYGESDSDESDEEETESSVLSFSVDAQSDAASPAYESDMELLTADTERSTVESSEGIGSEGIDRLSTMFLVLAYLIWVAVSVGIVWLRYMRLVVSR